MVLFHISYEIAIKTLSLSGLLFTDMIVLILVVCIAYCYLFIVLFSILGWKKQSDSGKIPCSYPFCSVVVAARNEEDCIARLIQSLHKQKYPSDCFEIIVIDDHSTDATLQILNDCALQMENLVVLSADERSQGKKQALQQALSRAKGELILFTDADCELTENWIESYVSFVSQHSGNLYFGNVVPTITEQSSLIEKCVALDFIGIVSVQNGLAAVGHPFSCNGANMCITKSFYKDAYDTNGHFASGDDVFLLHKAKRLKKNSVFFIPDAGAAVKTSVPNSVTTFFRQRCRWASKATGYKDGDSIFIACVVYVYCLILTVSALLSCFGMLKALVVFVFLFLIKLLCDTVLFVKTRKQFLSQTYVWLAIPLQCVYFLYTTFIPVVSLCRPIEWKSRKVKS